MSSYLEQCGISMGEKLVGPAKGNPRGHFEDIEFVEFHDGMLADNRCHMYNPRAHLTISPESHQTVERLIDARKQKFARWGWKDPRTTLFLDLWSSHLPDIPFIFLYRHPQLVADSLFKRGTDRRLMLMPWLAYIAWIAYNARIVDFYKRHPSKCLVLNIQGVARKQKDAQKRLSQFLGYSLDQPYSTIYKQEEISEEPRQRSLPRWILENMYEERLMSIYQSLESIAAIPEMP
ncbi:MAG: hypothetical protein MRJ96_11460 [Nitrospirales bacterium]|nr:hypothetical protein [Nitrospira sp.]MDR4502056.1 hypothetical protein [Nitrospirales bacterium]